MNAGGGRRRGAVVVELQGREARREGAVLVEGAFARGGDEGSNGVGEEIGVDGVEFELEVDGRVGRLAARDRERTDGRGEEDDLDVSGPGVHAGASFLDGNMGGFLLQRGADDVVENRGGNAMPFVEDEKAAVGEGGFSRAAGAAEQGGA